MSEVEDCTSSMSEVEGTVQVTCLKLKTTSGMSEVEGTVQVTCLR